MRALFSSSSLARPGRSPLLYLLLYRLTSPATQPAIPSPVLLRPLHDLPSVSHLPAPAPMPPSRILQSDPAPPPAVEESDEPMNEFLSRFVWAIRPKLSEAFPGIARHVLDEMLLIICQKVIARLDGDGSGAALPDDLSVDLSEDLWKTIWEVSNSVHEAMRRDRMREELRKYLHCDEVKEMCRFAGDVGIRGPMLRELRFKWAREKLEEVDFYRSLDQMWEAGQKQEEEANETSKDSNLIEDKREVPKVIALPQRKGKIKYKIYGLDLSDPEWADVAERAEQAEKHFVPEEPQPIEGKCKKIEEAILALDVRRGDPAPALAEWKELLGPKRVDWIALLERIKERNLDLYSKVAELLLSEESFEATIRDYSKLIDLHSKANQTEDAERVLHKMTEMGIAPDILTSITLVHMYSKVGNLDRAKEAFDSLKKEGFPPDLKVYHSMISAYVKSGLPKQGEMLTREMETRDIKPTKEIYMELMRAFAERGQVDGAQRIMNTMQFAGIQPTVESFTLLVEAYGKAGQPDLARGHFDHMMRSGHKPDDRCTASMVAAYMEKNLFDKALDLLLTLEKDGFRPGISTNMVLLDWFGRLLLVDEAEQILGRISGPGEIPFEAHVVLCDMYARARRDDKARKSLRILEGRKQLLRGDQFERIFSGLREGGFVDDAKRIYSSMQARGFVSEAIRVPFMTGQTTPRQRSPPRRGGKP